MGHLEIGALVTTLMIPIKPATMATDHESLSAQLVNWNIIFMWQPKYLVEFERLENGKARRTDLMEGKGGVVDVKRWLADFRENDMSWPETFNWSCKRRYKKGYVWQDLLDDDLITRL
ncbi:hypothetical protein ACLB2K_016662 [Fragaria x ananassa]